MNRRRRPFFFEIVAVANLLAVALLAHRSLPVLAAPFKEALGLAGSFTVYAVLGVVLRLIVARLRNDHSYGRAIRRRRWQLDTLRLIVFTAVGMVSYAWLKLVIPIYHPRLFDQQLWDLDRVLFFGLSPNIFFLALFRQYPLLRAFDLTYAWVFFASITLALAWFLSHPSRRIRVAFANGNVALWLIGAWLYFLIPSLGPAYRFPDIWFAHADALQRTQQLQAILMRNYQNVLRAARGEAFQPVQLLLGIAAFPSLHVGFQTFVFLWMRRLWPAGEVLFAIFACTIFLGSVITGWHYLVDALAGVLLALACFKVSWNTAMPRRR